MRMDRDNNSPQQSPSILDTLATWVPALSLIGQARCSLMTAGSSLRVDAWWQRIFCRHRISLYSLHNLDSSLDLKEKLSCD